MELNLVLLCGRLAAPPETRQSEAGLTTMHLLVTVTSHEPVRRIDVIPVRVGGHDPEVATLEPGARVWVCGSLQRRFTEGSAGRQSRLEVSASVVRFPSSLVEHAAVGRADH